MENTLHSHCSYKDKSKKEQAETIFAWLSIVVLFISLGIIWGILRTQVDASVGSIVELEKNIKHVELNYVKKEELREMIAELKDDNKIMQEDIKKILHEISKR